MVLRWYFTRTDDQENVDKYGYPIPYASGVVKERRLFSPPKQIKWNNALPLGNFDIEIYYQISGAAAGPAEPINSLLSSVATITGQSVSRLLEYMFTVQISEV